MHTKLFEVFKPGSWVDRLADSKRRQNNRASWKPKKQIEYNEEYDEDFMS